MTDVSGCKMEPLDMASCDEALSWVSGGEAPKWVDTRDLCWLLAHCDDGVIWGKKDTNSVWCLSNQSHPDISPPLRQLTLQQLRLFGDNSELLIWRDEEGLRGRLLEDEDPGGLPYYLKPKDESYVLLGSQLQENPTQGFSLVRDGTGSRHAVPIECNDRDFQYPGEENTRRWPLRLKVRHYFERNPEIGDVRITVSRLVGVSKA